MLIYHKNGWFEYRSILEGNCYCNGFQNLREEVIKRFELDVYTLLN